MNTLASSAPRAPSFARLAWLESRNEFLSKLRTPIFALPTLLFPVVFYLMFAVLMNRGSLAASTYLLATYGVFGVMGAAMFGFGVSVAMERTQGLLRLRKAMPMPPSTYLIAKLASAMVFSLTISGMLLAIGVFVGHAQVDAMQALALVGINLLGTLPFAAIGLYIGTRSGANGAPAIINLVFLPMAFLSGLWMPLSMLPAWLAKLAPVWPSYHLSQLALKVVDRDAGHPAWLHVAVLLVVTVVFSTLARARLRDAE